MINWIGKVRLNKVSFSCKKTSTDIVYLPVNFPRDRLCPKFVLPPTRKKSRISIFNCLKASKFGKPQLPNSNTGLNSYTFLFVSIMPFPWFWKKYNFNSFLPTFSIFGSQNSLLTLCKTLISQNLGHIELQIKLYVITIG